MPTRGALNLSTPYDWSFPVPIAYGPGRLAEIGTHCRNAGIKNPLIVTDQGSKELSFIETTENHLERVGLKFGLFSEISPNPRKDEITSGKEAYRRGRHDGVIAIGGGSGMDGGKAICLTAGNEIDLWSFDYDKPAPRVSTPFPGLICIPTTAGTGAETESTAMVTDTEKGMKFCVWHEKLKPSLALLDPEVTLGLPQNLTAWTGIDALVHAIEAYCVPSFHPLCDGIALEALALIHAHLPKAVENPGDITARGGMQVGACLAGVSFLKGLGLVHAISHMVGAEYDTHHGLTNAVTLPAVLRFNEPNISKKVPEMANALGVKGTFDGFYNQVCDLLDELSIPKKLSDIGVPLECTPSIAKKAMHDAAAGTNPRTVAVTEIQKVVEDALLVGR
ncbi:MAG: iron-containing alcohol dehydrogenase [Pseudomonadota bacterium]